ncbi:uncharacterized protein LOC103713842 [Phoenix dactylifera]|uniref:Uncharacterized protein LOC103713842 n=1 Tax=Phoenix dactylifera TaxID=42345 RepID=A0A8B7CHJ8_PHODC|nr:uncharacterized protein LOC103713842 [Phoenix dactylifera]
MEGSQDVYYKEKTVSPEKTKRKMKTPAQVEALEKFYNEHKYPSELMKLQFAKQIGLSEKQVSGWFCHRRLKDKKLMQGEVYANGKHYNGLVHDRTSGLRQESCSSTKQGDRYFDLKEVQSKRSYGQTSSSAGLALEPRGRQLNVGCHANADDRSSGSSSASQGRLLQQVEDPPSLVSSGYPSQGDNYMLMNTRGVKSRGPMMHSRCSYFQVENEHPAISSVKRKLGRHYCEDGPPLGVNFDPLPPGAFDSPIRDSNFEPYYVGDSMLHGASCIPRITKETKVYDKYRHEELSNGSYPEAIGFRKSMQGFVDQDGLLGCQLNSKASLTKQSGSVPKQTSLMEKIEDFGGKTSDYNSRSNKRHAKYRTKEGENSVGHLFHINGQKAYTNKAFPHPHNHYNYISQVSQREEFKKSKFSKSACKSNNFLDTEDVLIPRRSLKLGRKVSSMQFQQQDYVTKSSVKHSWRKPVIRNNGNMATTLSEDETGGTASSIE